VPELRPDRCTGTGDCATVCPAGAIRVMQAPNGWTWRLDLAPCMACGLCIDACPENALAVSPSYELAARRRADLVTELTFARSAASEAQC
jgi:formate hydrogenlyase subunit 6/NADH:ubiquinone oxidoreductase subunit I